ncbi:fructose-6-phosphate aldolase [Acidaminococcus fermentans]|uniref:fructose-6-phosphate aldolase n=1 Tax=Acidaminococcus fermentans TaxID=905 RepID=UPI00248FFE56|nr:fructose-6-phosphate aldolase [Acidaminococcus fermentans]
MKFFIDTANLDEIREAEAMGIISGVTTNPSLIAKEGRDYEETLREIAQIVDGPISGEVKASTTLARDMVMEGRVISQIHPNMVVKIPMTAEGLKAVKILASEGIRTNVTLVFSATQAILAARAGATYVSPFLGRLDDISTDGTRLIQEVMEIFRMYPDITTKVICASIRHPMHVVECAKVGADIATVPYKVLMQMVQHPLTRTGIEKFCQDFEAVFGR